MGRLQCLCLLLLVAACGNGEPHPEPGTVLPRTRLTPTSPAPAVPEDTVLVHRWNAEQLVAQATCGTGQLTLGPGQGNKSPVVLLPGSGNQGFELELEAPASFDYAIVELASNGKPAAMVALDGDGRILARSDSSNRNRKGNGKLQVVRIRGALKGASAIRLLLRGTFSPPTVFSLKLYRTPVASHYPAPDKPGPVRLNDDLRTAVGVTAARPVEVAFTPAENQQLSFETGRLADLPGPAALTVTLRDAGGAKLLSRRAKLERGRWTRTTIPVPMEARSARFELDPASPGPCALSLPQLESKSDQPPTVILLTTDTHRGDHLGLAAPSAVRTPFLDSVADEGLFFADCQAAANNTNPAHITVMTGLPVRDHGVIGNDRPVGAGAISLARLFGNAGYSTYATLSTTHLTWSGLTDEFDRVGAPPLGQRDSAVTLAQLEGYLKDSTDRPLFIWLHVFDAHSPYGPPEEYIAEYLAEESSHELGPIFPGHGADWQAWALAADPEWVGELYRAEVRYLDRRLSKFFAGQARARAAILAIVGDHGENMVHPTDPEWSFDHAGLSDATLHVPLILRFPGGPRGLRVDRPVRQLDVGRTLLDLAGLHRVDFPGRNLVLIAEEEERAGEQRFSISGNAFSASVREGRWLLVQGLYGIRADKTRPIDHRVQLFDVDLDPGCVNDLADEDLERTRALRTAVVRWLSEARLGQFGQADQLTDAASLEHLKGLGYTSSDELPESSTPWIDPDCECVDCERFPLLRR
jgi:arylsulfatase A-like enzyme